MSNINSIINNTTPPVASTTNTGTTAATSAAGAAAAGASDPTSDSTGLLGTTNDFLNLLMAQLKYQDPTEPMKGTDFIDSISRLSEVEQSINTNKYLSSINDNLTTNNTQMGSAVSYLNKSVTYNSPQFNLTSGVSSFSYDLPTTGTPTAVSLVITDSTGNVVVSTQGTTKAGANLVKWDGTDNAGNQLPDGTYTALVTYANPDTTSSNQSITVPTYQPGTVTGADFSGTTPMLDIGNISVPLSSIRSVTATDDTSSLLSALTGSGS